VLGRCSEPGRLAWPNRMGNILTRQELNPLNQPRAMRTSPIRCIIGLGNPGPKYAETRHNVGFRVIDLLAQRHRFPSPQRMLQAIVGKGQIKSSQVLLVKPMTFMNESGRAVARVCAHFALSPEDLLVIYDDINIDLGMLRLRREGSSGGHKGMQSVIDHLCTEQIPRLRLGIGRLPPEAEARGFVLSPFAPNEEEVAEELIQQASVTVESVVVEGIETAMSRFNS